MSLHLSWIERSQWQNLLVSSGIVGGRRTAPPPPRKTTPVVHSSEKTSTAPPFSPPPSMAGSLEERLVIFFQWLKGVTKSPSVFVADEHGLSIVADEGTADYSASSAAACHCMETFKQLAGGEKCEIMTLFLSDRECLNIIGGRIDWGWFATGLITPKPMPLNAIRQVREVFIDKALGPGDQGDAYE